MSLEPQNVIRDVSGTARIVGSVPVVRLKANAMGRGTLTIDGHEISVSEVYIETDATVGHTRVRLGMFAHVTFELDGTDGLSISASRVEPSA